MLPIGNKILKLVRDRESFRGRRGERIAFLQYFLPASLLTLSVVFFIHRHLSNSEVGDSTVSFLELTNLITFLWVLALFLQLSRVKKDHSTVNNQAQGDALKFSKIYDAGIIGLLFTRLDGRITEANDAFLNMIGYTREDMEQGLVNWNKLTPPAFEEVNRKSVEQLRKDGFCVPFEKEYIRKDGRHIHVILGSSMLGGGEDSYAVTYIVDITDKKQSEGRELELSRQLQHQQEELIRIFMNVPAMISIRRGPDLKLDFANKAALDFSGTGTHVDLTNAIREKFKVNASDEIMRVVYQTGRTFTANAYPIQLDRDGKGKMEQYWLDLVIEPLRDAEGNINGVVTFGFDVTELVESAQKIQESELRFRFLADVIPHKMWTSAPDGTPTYYNQGWYDYTGINDFETLKNGIWDMVHPDDREAASIQWIKAIENALDMEMEQRFRRYDGVYHWHLTRFCAHKNETGQVVLWVGTSTDIHERKVAREALQISEAHFRALTNNNSLPIWQVDKNCNMVFVNDTWRRYTGVTSGRITGEDWSRNIHPDDREAILHEFNELFKQRLSVQQKYRFRNSTTGEYRWMLDYAQPVFDPGFSGYIGSMTDIHEQELAQLAIGLLMEKKDEFLAIASHELKTPITTMKASLQVLDRMMTADTPGIQETKPFIAMANKQVNKLSAIVNDLLDVTRIQSGKLELNRARYDFRESLEECIRETRQYQTVHEFYLLDGDPVFVYADKIHIEQVIQNFISNAVKYSPGFTPISISIESNDHELKCSVIDSGIGIPADKQAFIFDRFFRVHDSSKSYAGLGLGLYISAEIIKQHQGAVGLRSEEGKGSTFWFTLPLLSKEYKPL